jgi:hypothetical protein
MIAGKKPHNALSPRVLVFNDFLPESDWQTVDAYCRSKGDSFEFIGYGSNMRYKEYTHSQRHDIKYQRSYLSDDKNDTGTRHGDNYKIYMVDLTNTSHFLYDEHTSETLSMMLRVTQRLISDIHGNQTIYESGPWLSRAPVGGHMNLHCDGTFIANPDLSTDFSAVYYVNDDYEGGELVIPVIGVKIKPKANSLILWSHVWHEDMAHGVLPVTKGERYMSQGFFASVD